jgi:Uma2 family endonuclease
MVATKTAPMVDGERMTPEEFDRRIAFEDEGTRIELIDGRVYIMAAPVGDEHGDGHIAASTWVGTWVYSRENVSARADTSVRLPTGNRVQPDVMLFASGSLPRNDEGVLSGVPGLVFEVAASSVGYDLATKREVYERAGVPEYIVWDVHQGQLFWFRLGDGRYSLVPPDANGVIESSEFPGLRLPVEKLLAGDRKALLDYALGREE